MRFQRSQKLALFLLIFLGLSACVLEPVTNAKSACEKEDAIIERVMSSGYVNLPSLDAERRSFVIFRLFFDFIFSKMKAFATQFLSVTVSHDEDQFPESAFLEAPRMRVIHPFGSVAAIKFIASNSQPFTGFFKGAPCGVMRFSLAGLPSETGIIPGVAVKFFVDNLPSVNFVAMSSLDEQQGFNFFKHDFSNFIEKPNNFTIQLLSNIFRLVTNDPFKVDVTHIAQFSQQGSVSLSVDAPVQLYLKPQRGLVFSEEPHEVRDDFASIPVGTVLYSVYGRRENETQEIYIGEIISKTKFISSSYGDEKLFFRHETVDGK